MMTSTTQRLLALEDYIVFGGMLIVSCSIGIYYGCSCFQRKSIQKRKEEGKSEAGELLVANGTLGTIPVALSMLASFLSSITFIGQPAEVYKFGPQLWMFGVSCFFYFGERFSRNLQLLASTMFTVQMVLYLALVLYAPAMALHQVTGLNTMMVVSVMFLVCIFYTTIGGMKAVVWTDSFQVVVLYFAMFAILCKGTLDIGGFSVVWQRNAAYNRTTLLSWNPDPTERYSIWSALFGSAFLHIVFYGGNQLQIQRYLTVDSAAKARQMLWINTVGWTAVLLLTVYAGMLIFAQYAPCDPMVAGRVKSSDELFPLYVMDIFHNVPGFPGLFLAGVFSAGLSTVSAGINSLAAITFAELEDAIIKRKISESRKGYIVQGLSLFYGVVSYMVVYLVPYMGNLAPITISLSGVFAGSLFALFVLGMFVPWSEKWGAAAGLIGSVSVLTWVIIGVLHAESAGQQVSTLLPIPVAQCDNAVFSRRNVTRDYYSDPTSHKEKAFWLYRVSYLYYSLISVFLTLSIGAGVSFFVNFKAFKNMRRKPKENIDEEMKVQKLLLNEAQTKHMTVE
ncbi:hypothetical protein M8J76_008110 [Diaphorina citri]|nr:hypothetical protein M8J76_008110 [Diaphorina citri]